MERGVIKDIYNSSLQKSNNNPAIAGQLTADVLGKLLDSNKVETKDVKFNQMAQDLLPNYDELRGGSDVDVALAVSSSQFPTISKIVINKETLGNYNFYMEDHGSLVKEIKGTNTQREYLAGFTDPEGPEMRPELHSYEETNLGEQDVEVRMADFGRVISLSKEAIFNDRTGQLLDKAQQIGKLGGQHRAKMIMQTLEIAARTAFKEATSRAFVYKGTAYAASAFYAASHATLDGRVNKNLVTSNALVDYTDIKNALDVIPLMKSPSGNELVVTPKFIIVPSALEVTAWQILHSDTFSKDPNNAGTGIYHQPNPYGPKGLTTFKPFVSRYLSSDSTWYLGDPAEQMRWIWIFEPATDSLGATTDQAFMQKIVLKYKFSYHGGVGHTDYVNIIKNTA